MNVFTGAAGSAFSVNLPPPDDRPNPDTMTCLGRWNLTLPGQHPFWSRYTLNLCHLRDCAGITPAVKFKSENTHEILVAAVDPDFPEDEFLKGGVEFLMPLNHVCQFVATDQVAYRVAMLMVQQLVDGYQIAEPSGIRGARDMFCMCVESLASQES